jgi:hypothetical protein
MVGRQRIRFAAVSALTAWMLVGAIPGTALAQQQRRPFDPPGRARGHDKNWKDRTDDRDRKNDRDRNRNQNWDRNRRTNDDNRQKTKNDWRNLAIIAGGAAAYGFIKNDPTIGFAGALGALYSLNRYEQDRKSQSAADRTRAHFFSQPYFERDGRRYERRLVTQNGQRYYRFERR